MAKRTLATLLAAGGLALAGCTFNGSTNKENVSKRNAGETIIEGAFYRMTLNDMDFDGKYDVLKKENLIRSYGSTGPSVEWFVKEGHLQRNPAPLPSDNVAHLVKPEFFAKYDTISEVSEEAKKYISQTF